MSLLPCPVSGVLPFSMACPAPSVTAGRDSGVSFVVRMTLRAVSSVRVGMPAMGDDVARVLRRCSVRQVLGSVVRLVSVEMPDHHAVRTWTDERLSDQLVNESRHHPASVVRDAEPDPKVASSLLGGGLLEPRSVHDGSDAPKGAGFVASLMSRYGTPSLHRFPSASALWDTVYQDGRVG